MTRGDGWAAGIEQVKDDPQDYVDRLPTDSIYASEIDAYWAAVKMAAEWNRRDAIRSIPWWKRVILAIN